MILNLILNWKKALYPIFRLKFYVRFQPDVISYNLKFKIALFL